MLAETTFNRSQELFDEQLLARETLDDAKARAQAAAAQVDLARAQFSQSEARVDELKIKLGKAIVRSPVNGFIGKRHVDAGAFASTNTPIVSVVDIAQIKLVANISEREFNRLQAGVPTRITVDAYPGEIFTGKLARLSPVLDPRTRMAEIEIEVANENFRLKPGMYAQVEITAERRKDSVVLPREALVGVGDTAGIFVIQRDSSGEVARFVSVKTGLQDSDRVEILEGISEGQYAVTTGASGLTDGDVVTVLGSFETLALVDQDEPYGRSEATSDTLSTELLKEPDGAVVTNSTQLETANPSMATASFTSQRTLEESLYTVQTGAIRERSEAKEVADQLSIKGYAAYVTTFTEGADRLYRVRVGTFEDQYEAEAIVTGLMQEEQFGDFEIRTFGGASGINAESNLDASNALTPTILQGSEMQEVATGSLLVSQPSEALNIETDTPMAVEASTYTVQVAAIPERAEAQQIVDQLFAKGYAAYVTTLTEGTNRLYRIRVGAFTDHSEAEAMAARLQKDEQFKTWITK
jgi:RND family efflux transporter MFP subunit